MRRGPELPPELRDTPPPPDDELDFELTPTLAVSIEIRVPTFQPEDSAGFKVGKLEEWTLGTAAVSGALSKERLEAHVELAAAVDRFDAIDAGGKTGPERERARALMDPATHHKIRVLRWRVERLTEEIDRLEKEYAKVSRAYTMISGT